MRQGLWCQKIFSKYLFRKGARLLLAPSPFIKSASNHILFSEYCVVDTFSIEGTHAQYLSNIATLSIIVEVLDPQLVVPDTEDLAADSMSEGGELAQLLIILYGGGQGEDQDYTTQHQLSHLITQLTRGVEAYQQFAHLFLTDFLFYQYQELQLTQIFQWRV